VTQVDLGRRQVHLVGSAAAMAKAFDVKISRYKHKRTGRNFRCPESDISVPASLSPIIDGVFGLNDMPVVVRNSRRVVRKPQTATDAQTQFPGSFYPNQVAKLYNFPPTQGQGQRVAILEFGGGFDQSVLADYFTNTIGLATPPTVNSISVLGQQMDVKDPATGEVYLDIEVVGGMAPKATMDVYFAPWTGQGYLNAIDQAIHNDDYAALSVSYGLDEDMKGNAANPGWPALNKNVDEAFRDAVAIGLPIFVSSGDEGSGCQRGALQNGEEITLLSPAAHVAYPSSSPYATAVGGTMLYAQNGQITDEVVWNELGALEQDKFYLGGATGGGVSDRYRAPSYQTSAGVNMQSANNPPSAGRCVPDVAGNAGVTTGYLVSQPPGVQPSVQPVGGTSAAAPMWAALMACIRESLTSASGAPPQTFFFNDFVYASGATPAFRDIVKGREITYNAQGPVVGPFTPIGSNRSTKVNGYSAKLGYDLCTGWGAPDGAALVKQLQTWLAAQAAAAHPQASSAPAPSPKPADAVAQRTPRHRVAQA
jgi:kumamolisin